MTDRTCQYCHKVFKFPSHLQLHLNAKRKCIPAFAAEPLPSPHDQNFSCRFCGRNFTEKTSMNRHVRTSCKIAPNDKNGDKGMERLYEHTLQKQNAEQNAKIDRLEAQNSEMKAMMETQSKMLQQLLACQGAPAASSATTTTAALEAGETAIQATDHAQVDASKKTFNINIFGKESLDHISMEKIKVILEECLRQGSVKTAAADAVLKTAMLVYSDPARPENLTAYKPNKKTKDAMVHTEGGWEVQPDRQVLPPMAMKSIDALFDNQPHSADYKDLFREIINREKEYSEGGELEPVLIRNKSLLAQALGAPPPASA